MSYNKSEITLSFNITSPNEQELNNKINFIKNKLKEMEDELKKRQIIYSFSNIVSKENGNGILVFELFSEPNYKGNIR